MDESRAFLRLPAAGLLFGVCAVLSISLTRFNGGFAMFWLATAAIVPVMLSHERRHWAKLLLMLAAVSVAVTGTVGLGWRAALPLAAANLGEVLIDVFAVSWATRRFRTFTALPWIATVYVTGGLLAPAASGVIAAATLSVLTGHDFAAAIGEWIGAHAMGFITLFPFAGLIARARVRNRPLIEKAAERWRAAGVLAVLATVGLIVFGQSRVPLLFVPTMVLMYAMLLCDVAVTAIGVLLLLIIAAGFTLAGRGPLAFVSADPAEQFLFLQTYFACIALTAAPIAVLLERRRRMFAKLAESEARYRVLADFSTDIIMVTDLEGRIRFASPSITQLGDYDPAKIVGTLASAMIATDYVGVVAKAHASVVARPESTANVEFLGITAGQHLRWFESHLRAVVSADGTVDGVCSVIRDIGHRKRREAELRAVALTDPLTGLANRRAFEMFVEHGGRDQIDGYVAVFDLDHFKRINDRFGHDCGDRVLKAFARAANSVVREDDVIARVGGEEFALFLCGATLAQARLICGRLIDALATEATLELPSGWEVTASVGLSPLDRPLGEVLKRADAALYEAKAGGRNRMSIAA